jgi:undecaprenyl-diphosphatase
MLADLIKAAVLGVVQGLTEFLPVSSTGHLILAEKAMQVDQDRYGLPFDAALHLGTLLALLIFFGSTWTRLIGAGIRTLTTRSLAEADGRMAWLLAAGTLPGAITGVLFEKKIEHALRSPWIVATMLITFSAVFLLAEALGKQLRKMESVSWADSVLIGCAQAVALIPGVSRSGATICMGLFRGLERRESAMFAFMLSAPIIAGAGGKQMISVVRGFADGTHGGDDAAFFATGMICSAIVGYAAIAFLLRYLSVNSLRAFVYYRVALGLLVYGVLLVRG